MKLFIDVGNSRLKWLLLAGNDSKEILCARKDSVPITDLQCSKKTIEDTILFKQIKKNISYVNNQLGNKLSSEKSCLKTIVWICVSPKLIEKKVIKILRRLYGKTPPKKIVAPEDGKFNFEMEWGEVFLKCNYENPKKFGADRWAASVGLASLGPYNKHQTKNSQEIILVSAGTATVIDRVIWKRISVGKWICELKGGIIFPGFSQMHSNMEFLDKYLIQKKGQLTFHPKNTEDAIKTGIALSQTLFERNKNKIIIVHGGESDKWIESYVFFNSTNYEPIRLPWLIFEGLYLINKTK